MKRDCEINELCVKNYETLFTIWGIKYPFRSNLARYLKEQLLPFLYKDLEKLD